MRSLKSVGAYRILDHIAEGGMAHVFRAVDRSRNLSVALKILKPEGTGFMEELRAMGAPWEGEISAKFDHANVVQTFEHGSSRQGHFIAMELLEWAPLMYLIRVGSPLVAAHRYAMLYQMGQGLAYIHDSGFIHHDLCPKNVLIASDGSPKIIDFGLTVPLELAESTRYRRSGTPTYMAPEVVRGRSFDERSDIYSFGLTMYETLTSKHPFRAGSKERKMSAQLNVQALPPSRYEDTISGDVDALILRAIAKEPDERFRNMSQLLAAIRKCFPSEALGDGAVIGSGPKPRRFDRVESQCFVRLKWGRFMGLFRDVRTVTKDLSVDGACCVFLRRPLEAAQRVDMTLLLGGHSDAIPIRGEVAWCRASKEQDTYEVGIVFRQVSATGRERIREYVAAHQEKDVS